MSNLKLKLQTIQLSICKSSSSSSSANKLIISLQFDGQELKDMETFNDIDLEDDDMIDAKV